MEKNSDLEYVPAMSATATNYVTDIIKKRGNIENLYIVEYGSGYSTKYFIDFM
jgi:hypothetical protein